MCSIVPQPITFATDGVLERPPLPGLYIKDVGDISLPLCESQAKEIIEMVKDNSDDPSVEERYDIFNEIKKKFLLALRLSWSELNLKMQWQVSVY